MKNTLIKLFKPNPKILTLNEIKESLGYKQISNAEKRHIVKKLLKLELDGKIYYDFVNNCYYVFPSDFFVSKVNKIMGDKVIFGINGVFEEAKIGNKELKKKDYIIVKKTKDGYKLIKVIGKPEELEDEEDLEKIYNLFNPYSESYTLKELMRITKASEDELKKELAKLENEGIAYLIMKLIPIKLCLLTILLQLWKLQEKVLLLLILMKYYIFCLMKVLKVFFPLIKLF